MRDPNEHIDPKLIDHLEQSDAEAALDTIDRHTWAAEEMGAPQAAVSTPVLRWLVDRARDATRLERANNYLRGALVSYGPSAFEHLQEADRIEAGDE